MFFVDTNMQIINMFCIFIDWFFIKKITVCCKKKIIENSLRGSVKEKLLINFTYTSEVKNKRDLRYINLSFEEFRIVREKYLKNMSY